MSNPYEAPQAEELNSSLENEQQQLLEKPVMASFSSGFTWSFSAFGHYTFAIGMWMVIALLAVIISIAVQFVPLIGGLIGSFLNPLLGAGLAIAAHHAYTQDKVSIDDLFYGFNNRMGDLALLAVINIGISIGILLLVVVLVFALGVDFMAIFQAVMSEDPDVMADMFSYMNMQGLILAVLVGAAFYLPLLAAMFFAPTLLILHPEVSVGKALKMSLVGCFKNFFTFIPLSIIWVVLFLIGLILLVIPAFIVVLPIIWISTYLAYREIFLKAE